MPHSTNLLSAIFHQPWMIDPQFAVSFGALVKKMVEGEIDTKYVESSYSAFYDGEFKTGLKSSEKLPDGSVAVINLSGAMLRDDDWCNYGTESLSEYIYDLADNPKVKGVLLKVNSGGGAADSVAPLEQAILYAKQKKPVLAVGPLMASAAYWVAAACDEIWLTENIGQVGSIGVMFSVMDVKPMWEAAGVKFHDVFAEQSSQKNKNFLEVFAGNYDGIKKDTLNPMAAEFIGFVKANRANLGSDETILQGKMFLAKDALSKGMIDNIGTTRQALARIDELAKERSTGATAQTAEETPLLTSLPATTQNTTEKNISTNHKSLNMKDYPFLLAMLGLSDALAFPEGSAHLSEEQVEQLQAKCQEKFGAKLKIPHASTDADGGYDIKPEGFAAMETQLADWAAKKLDEQGAQSSEVGKLTADIAKMKAELKASQDKVVQLSGKPEDVQRIAVIGATGAGIAIPKMAEELNVFMSTDRPWNNILAKMQAGQEQEASAMMSHLATKQNMKMLLADMENYTSNFQASSDLNIEKVTTELGDHKQVRQSVTVRDETAMAAKRIEALFPAFSTGIQNEYSEMSMYIKEFLQPRNNAWAKKGGFTFDAEKITVDEWQVSHTFSAVEIWQFTRSWLTFMVKGDNPYQMPLVAFLSRAMLTHIKNVERPRLMIKGVFQKALVDGTAGPLMNSMSGIMHSVQQRIHEHRILPTYCGTGDHIIHDSSTGLLNKNHFYYKLEKVYKDIPVETRDAFQMKAYVSKEDKDAYERFLVQGLAKDPNHAKQEQDAKLDNLTLEWVPFFPKGLIVITLPGNFVRLYRERGDDNRITLEKSRRDMDVFMDGAGKVSPIYSGQKYASLAELEEAGRTTQAIFTNAEFGPYTALQLLADDTSPSVEVHNVIVTGENTKETVITAFDKAVGGEMIYVIGGANENASKITAGGNFIGVPTGGLIFSTGKKAKFKVTSDGKKFILLAHWDIASEGTIDFEANDTKPSLAGGYAFITSPANANPTTITDFDDAEVGVEYKIVGGGGDNASKIAKTGKFAAISSAWTGDTGAKITLMKRADGTWVDII